MRFKFFVLMASLLLGSQNYSFGDICPFFERLQLESLGQPILNIEPFFTWRGYELIQLGYRVYPETGPSYEEYWISKPELARLSLKDSFFSSNVLKNLTCQFQNDVYFILPEASLLASKVEYSLPVNNQAPNSPVIPSSSSSSSVRERPLDPPKVELTGEKKYAVFSDHLKTEKLLSFRLSDGLWYVYGVDIHKKFQHYGSKGALFYRLQKFQVRCKKIKVYRSKAHSKLVFEVEGLQKFFGS